MILESTSSIEFLNRFKRSIFLKDFSYRENVRIQENISRVFLQCNTFYFFTLIGKPFAKTCVAKKRKRLEGSINSGSGRRFRPVLRVTRLFELRSCFYYYCRSLPVLKPFRLFFFGSYFRRLVARNC